MININKFIAYIHMENCFVIDKSEHHHNHLFIFRTFKNDEIVDVYRDGYIFLYV
jgi:hypothetical protein